MLKLESLIVLKSCCFSGWKGSIKAVKMKTEQIIVELCWIHLARKSRHKKRVPK